MRPAILLLRLLSFLFAFFLSMGGATAHGYVFGGVYATVEEQEVVEAAQRELEFRNYERAYDLSKAAIEQFPQSLEARRTFITTASSLLNLSEAIAWMNEFDGEATLGYHYAYGWAAVLSGDSRLGLQYFDRAMEQVEGDVPFELLRARLAAWRLLPGSDGKGVLDAYERFVARFPDVGLAHLAFLNTFNFHSEERRKEKAIKAAEALTVGHPELTLKIIDNWEREEFWFNPQKGLDYLNKSIAQFPDSTYLGLRKIRFLRRLGRLDDAIALCREWREKAPNHGDFINDLVDTLSDSQRWDEALVAAEGYSNLRFQDHYEKASAYKIPRILHNAGRYQEAAAYLSKANTRRDLNGGQLARMQRLLIRIQSREPEDRVKFVNDVGYLEQRGNYCGPATVHMIMQRWGLDYSQEDIASRVYTGVAGTPPQVIHHYAKFVGLESREFNYDANKWKELIDAGYPILWLQMNGREGGHYRVVVGYDDILGVWLVHDPNNYYRIEIPFERIKDTWILPDIGRSMVLFPPDRIDDPVLQGLAPSTIVALTNWVLYVSTGSNLFVGLFPAIFVNVAVALILAIVIARMMRRITFPETTITWKSIVVPIVVFSLVLNLIIGAFRLSPAVSLLLSFHLGLLTLIPLLILVRGARKLLRDYLHPLETLTITLLTFLTWLSLAVVDEDPWQWQVPVVIFMVGLPVAIYPRYRLQKALKASARGESARALEELSPYGIDGRRYFAALCLEVENLLMVGEYQRACDLARKMELMLSERPKDARVFKSIALFAGSLAMPNDEAIQQELDLAILDRKVPQAMKSLLATGRLYSVVHGLERTEGRLYTEEEIDHLLEDLNAAIDLSLPGFAPQGSNLIGGRPLLRMALVIALGLAIRVAKQHDDPERVERLMKKWGSSYKVYIDLAHELND